MSSHPPASKIMISRARADYFSRGILPGELISDTILRSWRRSVEIGLEVDKDNLDIPILTEKELRLHEEKNRILFTRSRPVMENLYGQIAGTSSIVILADTTGVILHSLGDADFVDRAHKVFLRPGGVWSEQAQGTNAIGTALVEQSSMLVRSSEHFSMANHFLTCSSSPIFDPHGALLGILDVSGDHRAHQVHTMALVRISAQQIENQMFAEGFESEIILHFHSSPEFIGTLYEAITVFGRDGRFIAANRSALIHLGLDRYQAGAVTFSELFDLPFDMLLSHACLEAQPVMSLRTRGGVPVFGRVKAMRLGPSRRFNAAKGRTTMPPAIRNTPYPTLESLEFGDPKMQTAISKARKLFGHDITVLIEGESGTGKELFAKAIHFTGPRSKARFVALNCAAIPEGLIESELFGYQEGAFTGAKRKGSIGKIRDADGGTLFLDEIGDMPLSLQARLLRVLQERTVTPLGGSQSYQVDLAIICATNRNLRAEITAGRFREDLYYRLNGLLLRLPRLSERHDRLILAQALLEELAGAGRTIHLNPEVIAIFHDHPWPGNVRQMHNVLRTALALLGDDSTITVEHLQEDFLEQFHEKVHPQPGSSPLSVTAPAGQEPGRLDVLESAAVCKAVEEAGGNISAAARRLGIGRNTLYRKMKCLFRE